jgi:hypothetical protein
MASAFDKASVSTREACARWFAFTSTGQLPGTSQRLAIIAYEFPKPGTKELASKEALEARVGKQACGVSYFKT